MTRDELLQQLKALADLRDPEEAHIRADSLLVDFIDDKEILEAYYAFERWYA